MFEPIFAVDALFIAVFCTGVVSHWFLVFIQSCTWYFYSCCLKKYEVLYSDCVLRCRLEIKFTSFCILSVFYLMYMFYQSRRAFLVF